MMLQVLVGERYMRVLFNGRIPAFQAGCVGSIPITRSSIFNLICAFSSAGQSNCLLSSRSGVRVPQSAPLCGGYSSVGQSARLWPWRSSVRIRLSTPFFYTQNRWNCIKKLNIGVSSSGKTQHFDCCIRRFESCHPCQRKRQVSTETCRFQFYSPCGELYCFAVLLCFAQCYLLRKFIGE